MNNPVRTNVLIVKALTRSWSLMQPSKILLALFVILTIAFAALGLY
jgi:hypothetical protein